MDTGQEMQSPWLSQPQMRPFRAQWPRLSPDHTAGPQNTLLVSQSFVLGCYLVKADRLREVPGV